MILGTDDEQKVVFDYPPNDEVKASFLYSVDIPHDELSFVLVARECSVTFDEVTRLPPYED